MCFYEHDYMKLACIIHGCSRGHCRLRSSSFRYLGTSYSSSLKPHRRCRPGKLRAHYLSKGKPMYNWKKMWQNTSFSGEGLNFEEVKNATFSEGLLGHKKGTYFVDLERGKYLALSFYSLVCLQNGARGESLYLIKTSLLHSAFVENRIRQNYCRGPCLDVSSNWLCKYSYESPLSKLYNKYTWKGLFLQTLSPKMTWQTQQ